MFSFYEVSAKQILDIPFSAFFNFGLQASLMVKWWEPLFKLQYPAKSLGGGSKMTNVIVGLTEKQPTSPRLIVYKLENIKNLTYFQMKLCLIPNQLIYLSHKSFCNRRCF